MESTYIAVVVAVMAALATVTSAYFAMRGQQRQAVAQAGAAILQSYSQLTRDLRVEVDRLAAKVIELEAVVEKLRVVNKELKGVNEKLQVVNKELKGVNEELQVVNISQSKHIKHLMLEVHSKKGIEV